MSSAGTPRSFDPPRRRPVPDSFDALDGTGQVVRVEVESPSLIVVVKDNCQGCGDFVSNQGVIPISLLVVTESQSASKAYDALYAPDFIGQIDARFAPVYLLAAGSPLEVVAEGTVFSTDQVLAEIAPLLSF